MKMSEDTNDSESEKNCDVSYRRAILQELVRMGSFTTKEKFLREDTQDDDVHFEAFADFNLLRITSSNALKNYVPTIQRRMNRKEASDNSFRVLQWNILAQALAEGLDSFKCPYSCLNWEKRRWRILHEISVIQPDVVCLQEVDHYSFFKKAFESLQYEGHFCPKPDSPCLYIEENNGPDGCAVFINSSKFKLMQKISFRLRPFDVPSNQVAILCKLRRLADKAEFWVATTHLKARTGWFLSEIREAQGIHLMEKIEKTVGSTMPLIIAGDLNAAPSEPVHDVLKGAGLRSAYRTTDTPFTTWTIREDGEHCHALDYIYYNPQCFEVQSILEIPSERDIGPERAPSMRQPSDHFALVADFVLSAPS